MATKKKKPVKVNKEPRHLIPLTYNQLQLLYSVFNSYEATLSELCSDNFWSNPTMDELCDKVNAVSELFLHIENYDKS